MHRTLVCGYLLITRCSFKEWVTMSEGTVREWFIAVDPSQFYICVCGLEMSFARGTVEDEPNIHTNVYSEKMIEVTLVE